MASSNGVVDITILGAGPTGLAAAYYAGHRDASVRIVESLEQLGGQVAATYPEKHVYDVAGHPKILGQKLVDLCEEQGLQYGAQVHLGEEAKTLERINQNGEELLALTTDKGGTYLSRAMIITAGHGAFEPRKLGVDGIDEWQGRGLHYVVREKAQFAGKRGAIAEWGIELEGKRQIKIDPMTCETSMAGVYAAGDVAGYPGKITLITVGMGEAAIAANNVIAAQRGEKVQPKYSTD